MVTSYDATFARLCEKAGIELLLVGDSYGMVALGYDTTTYVELDDMVRASAAVARGTLRAHIVTDLPFGSYESSDAVAVAAATLLVKRGLAGSVKMEGRAALAKRAEAIVAAGVPVLGHIGVCPQTAGLAGGYRALTDRDKLLEDARAFERAGAYAIVLEKIASDVAATITRELSIPTIGIGSGPDCDGQVLVLHDILGLYPKSPPFAKQYATLGEQCETAIRAFASEVRVGQFPPKCQKPSSD